MKDSRNSGNSVETQLTKAYMQTYGYDDDYKDYPDSPKEAVKAARSKDDVLFDPDCSDKDLYYAFLADYLASNKKELATCVEGQPLSREFCRQQEAVAKMLWKENVDYFRVFRCLAYMPLEEKPQTRYMMSVTLTAAAVNPVLTLPEVSEALPINRLNAKQQESDGSLQDLHRETYNAYLKAVLTREPSLRLREADKKIAKLMLHYKVPANAIPDYLTDGSLEFMTTKTDNKENDLWNEVCQTAGAIKLVKEACNEMKKESAQSVFSMEKVWDATTDDDIYKRMQKAIRDMKEQHETGDMFDYWQKTIAIMKQSLSYYESYASLSKTVQLLSIGMERASKECDVKILPEFDKVQAELKQVLQKTAKDKENWSLLKRTTEAVVKFSSQLLKDIHLKRAKNPLLQITEVQHAKPLKEVLQAPNPPPKDMYFSALRETAQKMPEILLYDADREVARTLKAMNVPEEKIQLSIANSPDYKNMSTGIQMMVAQTIMEDAFNPNIGTQQHEERGKQR